MQNFCAMYITTSLQTGSGTAGKIDRMERKGGQIWTDAVWVRTTGECLAGKAVTQVSFFCRIRDKLLSVSFN